MLNRIENVLAVGSMKVKLKYDEMLEEMPKSLIVRLYRIDLFKNRHNGVANVPRFLVCHAVKTIPEVICGRTIERNLLDSAESLQTVLGYRPNSGASPVALFLESARAHRSPGFRDDISKVCIRWAVSNLKR